MGVLKKGGSYWIDYRVKGRRKREKIGPSKELAKTVLNKRLIAIAEGRYLDIRRIPKILFKDFSDDYLEYSKANKKNYSREVYLVSARGEKYVSPHTGFRAALKRAGIADFHFHDCRHTFASRLVMGGVDIRTVQELLGHKTMVMTLRYSHLSPEHRRKAVTVLDRPAGAQIPGRPLRAASKQGGHFLDTKPLAAVTGRS